MLRLVETLLGGVDIEGNAIDIIGSLQHKLLNKIKESTGLTMRISIKNQGTVRRSEGGKLSRVTDQRKL